MAVKAGDGAITYGELDKKANRIAAVLRAKGAGPEKLVAIFEERGIDLVAAMLGVAKSGAAYVPLDPAYPKGRIENILEDAQPVAVLTSTDSWICCPSPWEKPVPSRQCAASAAACASGFRSP